VQFLCGSNSGTPSYDSAGKYYFITAGCPISGDITLYLDGAPYVTNWIANNICPGML